MMKLRTRTARKVRRWAANLLLLAGAMAVSVWAWANIRGAAYQSWGNWKFEREVRGQAATVSQYLKALCGICAIPNPPVPPPPSGRQPHGPPAIADGDPIGRLLVPRLRLSAMVREGTEANTLDVALGHISGTAMAGQNGNIGIAGHRDTLFRRLGEIRKDDVIRFQTIDGDYVYEVESTEIVTPKSVGVLRAGQHPEITLVTCYPFRYVGPAPDRFIVKARLVAQAPDGQEGPAVQAEVAQPETEPAHARARPLAHERNLSRRLRRAHAN